jgi:hypothetical protein
MLEIIKEQKAQLAEYREIMVAQEKMIYQALMSANLPTARRNAVDEEHLQNLAKIKEATKEGVAEENEAHSEDGI